MKRICPKCGGDNVYSKDGVSKCMDCMYADYSTEFDHAAIVERLTQQRDEARAMRDRLATYLNLLVNKDGEPCGDFRYDRGAEALRDYDAQKAQEDGK